jgi:hypothetical protein
MVRMPLLQLPDGRGPPRLKVGFSRPAAAALAAIMAAILPVGTLAPVTNKSKSELYVTSVLSSQPAPPP